LHYETRPQYDMMGVAVDLNVAAKVGIVKRGPQRAASVLLRLSEDLNTRKRALPQRDKDGSPKKTCFFIRHSALEEPITRDLT
jgi:hypothetical protein